VNPIENTTVSSLAQVALEENITKEEDYNFRLQIPVVTDSNLITGDQPISAILSNYLLGCGKVDLIKFQVIYQTTKASQIVKFGVCNTLGNRSLESVVLAPGGVNFMSNTYNFGVQEVVDIVIPDTISRQIQPASSHLPSLRFKCSVSSGVAFSVIFYLKFHGPMFSYAEAVKGF